MSADPDAAGSTAFQTCFSVLPTQRGAEANPAPIIPSEPGKTSAKSLACTTGIFELHTGSFREESNKSVKEGTREDTFQSGESSAGCPSIWAQVPRVEARQGVPEVTLATQPSGHSRQALRCLTRVCLVHLNYYGLVHCLTLIPHSFPCLFHTYRSGDASSYHHVPNGCYGYKKAAASLHPAPSLTEGPHSNRLP